MPAAPAGRWPQGARGAPLRDTATARLLTRSLLAVAWVLAVAYLAQRMDRGWVPHDDGALAQSAERVLAGELPHRDFDEIYTGGLSYLHAAAFRLFGVSLLSMRYTLLVFSAAWLPVLYYICRRFTTPVGAGLAVAVGLVWSLPNYFAPLPSWYNLFLATFGIACLLRHLETNRTRWLLLAGMWGGLSVTIKVVGVYYIAAALLFFIFRAQSLAQEQRPMEPRGARVYSVLVTGALAALSGLLVLLVRTRPGMEEIVHFVLPGLSVIALLVVREWRHDVPGGGGERLRVLLGLSAPFLLGVAIPVMLLLLPYLWRDAVADLVRGVFVLPSRRISAAAMSPPALRASLGALAQALVLVGLAAWGERRRRGLGLAIVLAGGGLILALAPVVPSVYRAVWNATRVLIPPIVLYGVWAIARGTRAGTMSAHQSQQAVLLVGAAALCSLVQFPFAAPIYYCYSIPLLVLAVLSLAPTYRWKSSLLPRACAGMLAIFGLLWLNPGYIYRLGLMYSPDDQSHSLSLDRAGIRVSAGDKFQYEELVKLVREKASGQYIYAAPDAPEVYFLAGYRNPTRSLFEIFDDPSGRTQRVLDAVDERRVRVVVLKQNPGFSDSVSGELRAALESRFPHETELGSFLVRWRS